MSTAEFVPNKMVTSALGIRGKLLIGFATTILIFIVAIAITYYTITTTKYYANTVANIELPTYELFIDVNSEIYQSQIAILSYTLTGDTKYKDHFVSTWKSIENEEAELDNISIHWDKSLFQSWHEVKDLLSTLKLNQEKIIKNSALNDQAGANKALIINAIAISNHISEKVNSINSGLQSKNSIIDYQSGKLHKGTQDIVNDLEFLQITTVILTAIGILISLLIALYTSKSILRYINVFREHSSRVASGDLTQHIKVEGRDEMSQLGYDLNTMTSSLSKIANEIIQACQTMVSTVEEVRQSVDIQSSGAAEQASSINEITSSLSEIEKSSSQTMQKAKLLGDISERTREKGQTGLTAVDQSTNGMKEVRNKVQMIAQTILDLSNKTQQIGEITVVVNNIAQQSKMLALNASIEAAKAGEAGKGFAVVAIEVKNLAEQSEQATAQVQKILEDIRHATEKAVMVTEEGTKGVDQGAGLVEQTGEIIRALNDVIHETAVASQQIEAAVRQEGAGIEQITAGMNEINQVTSSFSASVHQTTEAMSHLANIAKKLKSFVEIYKL